MNFETECLSVLNKAYVVALAHICIATFGVQLNCLNDAILMSMLNIVLNG